MADHSQKSMRNDGQKTAIYLGKGKYFSHFLPSLGPMDRVLPDFSGFAAVRRSLCISCF
jgi:hypothetical protein